MKYPRMSMATTGFVILVVAIDLGIARAALSSPNKMTLPVFCFFMMPMIDVMLISLYRLRKPNRRAAKQIGFLTAGSIATLATLTCCGDSPELGINILNNVGRPIATFLMTNTFRLFGNGAITTIVVGVSLELFLPLTIFCTPSLAVAFIGRGIAHRWFGKPTFSVQKAANVESKELTQALSIPQMG